MKKIYAIILMSFLYGNFLLQAQQIAEKWEFASSATGNQNYIARDFITFKPGFSYIASQGNSFTGSINQLLLFPPTENMYITESGRITTDPTQGGAVGNLSGNIDVGKNGALSYSVPIECLPGINGMQPNITLNYNSMGGDGTAGWGWNLGGLSMISRIPKNYYHDDERSGINWTYNSPLALDGQRMIETKRWESGVGTTRPRIDSIEYCLENETSIRIVGLSTVGSGQGYQGFKVYYKDGKKAEYTNALNIKNVSRGIYNLGWTITKIIDSNNNYVSFDYTNDFSSESGSYKNNRIQSITYGNDNGGINTIVGRINFEYKDKTDLSTPKYVDGMRVYNEKIMQRIEIKDPQSNLIEKYELAYNTYEDKDMLTSVKRTNAAGESFLPLKFEWTQPSYAQNNKELISIEFFRNVPWDSNNLPELINILTTGDIDGDGLTDLVLYYKRRNHYAEPNNPMFYVLARNDGDGIFTCGKAIEPPMIIKKANGKEYYYSQYTSPMLMDIDNDGKDELLFIGPHSRGFGSQKADVSIEMYKYSSEFKSSCGYFFIENSLYDRAYLKSPGDDGYTSLYAIPGNFLGNGETQFFLFSTHNHIEGFYGGAVSLEQLKGKGHEKSVINITDINGNGKNELMFTRGGETFFFEFNENTKAFECIYQINNTFDYRDKIITADFSGDGNTDIMWKSYRDNYKWKLFRSDGKSLTLYEDVDWGTGEGNIIRGFDHTVQVVDLNQDGKSDILFTESKEGSKFPLTLLLNKNNFFEKIVLNEEHKTINRFNLAKIKKQKNTQDLIFIFNRNFRYLSIDIPDNLNKINKITDSFGNQTSIQYKKAKNPVSGSSFTDDFEKTSSLVDEKALSQLPSNFLVVDNIISRTARNTIIGSNSYEFIYPQIDKQARGFLGFSQVEVENKLTGIKSRTISEYDQVFHFLYPKKQTTQLSSSSSLISETTSSYTVNNLGNKKYFLRPDSQTSKDYLVGTTVTKTFSDYDADRNPKKIVTDYGGGIVEEQVFVYEKKGSHFYNKISKSTVTKKATGEQDYKRVVDFAYDTKGNLTKKTEDEGDKNAVVSEYRNYDKFGNAQQIDLTTNGKTRSSHMTYSPSGRFLKTETNHLGETTSYEYDENKAVLLSMTDRIGTTTYKYDNFRRLASTLYPNKRESFEILRWASNGGPAHARYYSHSEVSGTSPVKVWYDGAGRELRTESYGLNDKKIFIDTEYNTQGRVKTISEPYFENNTKLIAETHSYDKYGRTLSVTTPMGTTSYDYKGLVTTVTTPNGKTKTTLNSAGQTANVVQNDKKVTFEYYASGLTKSVTPQDGHTVSMEYDLQGNRTKLIDPDAGTIDSEYNGWGQIKWTKQFIHSSITPTTMSYEYYDNGLLKKQNAVTNVYDDKNRIKTQHNSFEKKTYEYDSFDRIIALKNEYSNKVTRFEYDAFGHIKKEIYPSGYYIHNIYDKYGNLSEVKDKNGRLIWKAVEMNAKGQYKQIRKGDVTTSFAYDDRGFPEQIFAQGIVDFSYKFNEKGNLESRRDGMTNRAESFTYDNLNRLTGWSNGRASYDEKGNMKPNLGTFNYGANGKPHALTSITNAHPDIWEGHEEERQIYYTNTRKPTFIGEGNKTMDAYYGVSDQLVELCAGDAYSSFCRYYYNNYEEEDIYESGVSNPTNKRKIHYIYGGDGIAAVYVEDNTGYNLYYTYTDYLGSLVALVKPDKTVAERNYYSPWGLRSKVEGTSSSFLVSHGYTMHTHLDEFNLIHMGGRMYDPLTMMFLSPDPYIQSPSNWINFNRYAYGFQNPFSYTDPNGEIAWIPIIIGAAIGAYTGGTVANDGNFNPTKWDYGSIKTWGYMIGGAAIGGASGALGAAVASSNMPFANTLGMMTSSFSNSLGMNLLTNGAMPISVNFGIGSYDLTNNSWGYLGKKGNRWYENLGYAMGGTGNSADIISFLNGGGINVDHIVEKKDMISHAALVNQSEGINISVGPAVGEGIDMGALKSGTGTIKELKRLMPGRIWENHATDGKGWKFPINNVSKKILSNMSNNLQSEMNNQTLMWNLLGKSCVGYTSKALWAVGVPNLGGIHPYFLQMQMVTRQVGIYANPYLYQIP